MRSSAWKVLQTSSWDRCCLVYPRGSVSPSVCDDTATQEKRFLTWLTPGSTQLRSSQSRSPHYSISINVRTVLRNGYLRPDISNSPLESGIAGALGEYSIIYRARVSPNAEINWSSCVTADYDTLSANPFFYLWVVSMIVSSCYTYTWDIRMDWGLFDANAGENRFLREEIVYSSVWYYYVAIVADLLLRFGWTLSLSLTELGLIHADLMLTILSPLEVFR